MMALSINQIRSWLECNQRRKNLGERVPSMTDLARQSGISRQTLYALAKNERSEFGQTAQQRLSQVILSVSADPAYQQTRLMRISMASGQPHLRLGSQP